VLAEDVVDYVALGTLGFLVIHLFDFVSLKRLPGLKPVVWLGGSGLLAYAIVMACLVSDRLMLPVWSMWLGWLLLAGSLVWLLVSLFVNLPFKKTYLSSGVGDRLVKTGLYALVRHPGVYGFVLVMLALFLVSGSSLVLVAAPVWILLDILLVVIQDRFFFPRMFPGYEDYQQETPMLVPNRRSLSAFMNGLVSGKNQKQRRSKEMSIEAELFKQGRYQELWQRCCGFIDLSLSDFMRIQRRLLLEQLALLKKCELGRKIMNGTNPQGVEEFRELVPLTTYADYAPYLLKRKLDALPEKPILWQHTSGRSGEYKLKWVPMTERFYQELGPAILASVIFGTCKRRGEIKIRPHDRYLYTLAPPPYVTGTYARRTEEVFPTEFLPPLDEAEKMSFEERVKVGFELALSQGMDMFCGIASVLVAIGNRFSQGGNVRIRPLLGKPRIMLRLMKGVVKSKLAGRPLLPRDIWSLKGILAGGTDVSVYKEKIKEMWGLYPIEGYGCTESSFVALQTWDCQGMTFLPNFNFLEFIPEVEALKSRQNPEYEPRILLLNEVKAGENYELVVTNFHGGALVRYRIGDMIRITSLRNEELGIDIPQMVFHSRIDDMIDIAGFTRLTEKVLWQAIANSGVACKDWTARKEVKDRPILHLYLELEQDDYSLAKDIALKIHEELKKIDEPYADLESFLGIMPIEVSLISSGTFMSYMEKQKAAGVDLGRLKPPHMNPSENVVEMLLGGAGKVIVSEERRPEAVEG
jgi:protein-S-isoprenylcysteine O-methyltransferase Ste14